MNFKIDKRKFISLENIMRYYESGIDRMLFFNIELLLPKIVADKHEIFLDMYINTVNGIFILNQKKVLFRKNTVFFNQSHEDPIVEVDDNYCFAMNIERNVLKKFMFENKIKQKEVISIGGKSFFYDNNKRIDIIDDKLENIPWDIIWSNQLFTKFISDYEIKTNIDALLTFHKTDSNGFYSEESYLVKKDEIINFYDKSVNNVYLGIQFSIDSAYREIEIEEKYVVKGQKGMSESGLLKIKKDNIENLYYPNIIFNSKYINILNNEKFKEINDIKELINFYDKNQEKINFFEISVDFLIQNYKEKNTYSQSFIYSTKPSSKYYHIDTEVCKKCSVNHICIQNIPSNLSSNLKKSVLFIEKESDCKLNRIFKIVKNNKIT